MAISLEELTEFLSIAAEKGFINDNTANARRTACSKFFGILDEDQKNVEYVRDNLDVVKARFQNLNKDVTGSTVDEYARRVKLVIDDFTAWTADRSGWEKSIAAKQSRAASGEGEKKSKAKTAEKPKPEAAGSAGVGNIHADPSMRTVEFPLRNGDAKVTFPRELTMADVKKMAWGLMTYATDFDPEVSTRDPFPALGQQRDIRPQ